MIKTYMTDKELEKNLEYISMKHERDYWRAMANSFRNILEQEKELNTPKVKGTVEEQCFDVVHADIGKELITSIRIGQGNDRKTHLDIKNMSVGESMTLLTSLEGNVKWRSVYEDIATVDSGVINANKAGMTTIIADNKNGEQEFWGVLVV